MTPDRIRECLQSIKRPTPLSQRGFAALIHIDERQVRRWVSGDYAMPSDVAEWLEKVADFYEIEAVRKVFDLIEAFHASNPPPVRIARKENVEDR